MKVSYYSVFDTKLGRFNYPYMARNDQEAVVILLRSGIPKSIYDDTKLYKLCDFVDEIVDVEKDSPLSALPFAVEVKLPPYPNSGGDSNV